ncbi:putative plectin [Trypanosoma cruzi]|uniref:Putative plectin n=1 Tax=Trypanosoma cruzi TaxID=5693 RepID=A0A2V2WH60_TRYCR|nr:putative plectin [Trypanosoma cruzi]
MHRMEAEMAAENAKLKEELCRMQQSHEEEIEAALLEASDRIAEHDDLLRHKLEEQEAELEARFLEQLNSFKEPGGDSDALHSLLSLKEENAKLKEELCRMQQSHEEERQAAGAAMHRMEAGMRSQQQTQLAGPPRRAAASSRTRLPAWARRRRNQGHFLTRVTMAMTFLALAPSSTARRLVMPCPGMARPNRRARDRASRAASGAGGCLVKAPHWPGIALWERWSVLHGSVPMRRRPCTGWRPRWRQRMPS